MRYLCSREECVWTLSNRKQLMGPVMKLLTLNSRATFLHSTWRCWDWDRVEDTSPLPAGPQSGASRQTEGEGTRSFLFCLLFWSVSQQRPFTSSFQLSPHS